MFTTPICCPDKSLVDVELILKLSSLSKVLLGRRNCFTHLLPTFR